MDIVFWSLIVVALTDALMGCMVIWRAPRSWYRVFFFLFASFVSFWVVSLAFVTISRDNEMALLFARTMFLCGALIPVPFYFFSKTFPRVTLDITFREFLMCVIPSIALAGIILFTDLIIAAVDTTLPQVEKRIFFGPALMAYGIYYFSYVLVSLENLWGRRKAMIGLERLQVRYVLQAFFFSTLLCGGANILLPVFKIYSFVTIGPYFTLFFVGLITYAILKYRLMNIEIAVKRSLVYAMVVGCIIALYLLLIFVLDLVFKTGIINNNATLLVLIFAVSFTAVTFSSFEEWFQRVSDRIFFKGKYDYQQFLRYLEKTVAGIIELDNLLGQVSIILQRTIKVERVFFFVLNKESGQYVYRNMLQENSLRSPLSFEDPLIRYMSGKRRILVYHELKAKLAQKPTDQEIVERMKALDIDVCIPLVSRNQLLGILCLGRKLSGDIYTAEDIVLFDTFDAQLGTALENAYLHKEAMENQQQVYKSHRLATIGTMTAGIAHEIKNPMVALKTFTEILPKKFDDPVYRQKYMELVPREIDRINDLLESLLTLSRPGSLKPQLVDIASIIQELELLLKSKMEHATIDFVLEQRANLVISADKVQIGQALLNLMLNAIQFMPHGGRLTVQLEKEQDTAVVRISDTGVGIPQENLGRLFDPFFTTRHEGTGLGLSITQKIIEEHHGTLSVTSKVGAGTTFTLRFPRS